MTLATYRASLGQARGDVAGTMQHEQRALDMADPNDRLARGGAAGFLGLAAWANGDIEPAVQTFGHAVESLHAAGNLADELSSPWCWATCGSRSAAEQGTPSLRRCTAPGHRTRPRLECRRTRSTADLHVGLAELDRELGELAAANRHLETAQA
jgi:LuxR family transcriptional regulator, maltose regulon positive regulatory protein